VPFLHALLLSAALVPHPVALADGRRFALNLPADAALTVAAEKLRRVRFMARAPDGRLFVTDMYNRTDNARGRVYVLDGFDAKSGRFTTIDIYLDSLRNPNSVAFFTDDAGVHWLYVALTDKLLRYRYLAASKHPAGEPQVVATFPAYGLDYKYGGWHLTRTIAIGPDGRIYLSAGSSCNACVEEEEVRATVTEMAPDGSDRRLFATGLRNAVGLAFSGSELFATNMGADHLGDSAPLDTFYRLQRGAAYGWPQCYVAATGRYANDPRFPSDRCAALPRPWATFPAHASPLGFVEIADQTFLVALHGSSKRRLNHGYRVVRVRKGKVEDYMTGFLAGTKVLGRPAGVFRYDEKTILVSDDYAGVIYAIRIP